MPLSEILQESFQFETLVGTLRVGFVGATDRRRTLNVKGSLTLGETLQLEKEGKGWNFSHSQLETTATPRGCWKMQANWSQGGNNLIEILDEFLKIYARSRSRLSLETVILWCRQLRFEPI